MKLSGWRMFAVDGAESRKWNGQYSAWSAEGDADSLQELSSESASNSSESVSAGVIGLILHADTERRRANGK